MLISPYSFIIIAGLRPVVRQWSSSRCSRVVLPLPRNPEMRWTGIRSASEKIKRSLLTCITRKLFQDYHRIINGEEERGGWGRTPPRRARGGKGGKPPGPRLARQATLRTTWRLRALISFR